MVEQFYVGRGSKKAGPFSTAQLKGLAAAGRLQPTDTVWKEGMDKPVPAAKVKNLFVDATAGAPPPAAETAVAPALDGDLSDESPALTDSGPSPTLASPSGDDQPAQSPEVPKEKPSPRVEHTQRKRRTIAVKGCTIASQDGVYASYRKKCTECGHEDPARTNMLIGHGVSRVNFFCPKCRKNREILIQGVQM